MAEYTQGKWEVKGLKIECFGQGIIALCPTPQEGGTFNCSANARLIAKAPAMYEALKKANEELKRYLEDCGGCDHAVGICTCDLRSQIESNEAVLSAIEGGNK
jgi:hypothetical protein